MIKIGICDDHEDYIEIISFKIRKCLEELNLEAEFECFNSLESLSSYLKSGSVNILFLDIMLGEESSIDWAVQNLQNSTMQVIYMTDFPEEAYNISETEHAYFLVKGRTDDEMLSKALKKVVGALAKKDSDLIVVKQGSNNYTLNVGDIMYIESLNNNISIHLSDNREIVIYSTLKDFSKKLPPNFLRCHKSYMVNMNNISQTRPHEIVLTSGNVIPVPPRKFNEIIAKYQNYIKLF